MNSGNGTLNCIPAALHANLPPTSALTGTVAYRRPLRRPTPRSRVGAPRCGTASNGGPSSVRCVHTRRHTERLVCGFHWLVKQRYVPRIRLPSSRSRATLARRGVCVPCVLRKPVVDASALVPGFLAFDISVIRASQVVPAARCAIAEVPGVGILAATAVVAAIGDAKTFKSGGEFAAFAAVLPDTISHQGW